jgi:hypothetical protein
LLEPQIFPRFAQGLAEPLTAERLFGWHAALFPTGRGACARSPSPTGAPKKPMQVVSGRLGREPVHYAGARGVEARSKDACIPRVV